MTQNKKVLLNNIFHLSESISLTDAEIARKEREIDSNRFVWWDEHALTSYENDDRYDFGNE